MRKQSTQLLVIGGGATGLGIAWDACLRGIRVVVVEQGDLGQGTSGRYHGLLHSGARYVISDPVSAQECALENAVLRRIAPATIEDTGGLYMACPGDPADWPDRWLTACRQLDVPVEEIEPAEALRREPLLNPQIERVFTTRDAALDSFDLLHMLTHSIRAGGGQVWLRHRLDRLIVDNHRVVGAEITSLNDGEKIILEADLTVNATGPWAGLVARLAGIEIPIALGRGSMVAVAARLIHTVVNRCRPPADGDLIVPVGTVAVFGTTDTHVEDPADTRTEAWEVDKILKTGAEMIPSLPQHRPLRVWAGVRPLYRPEQADAEQTRALPRAHTILDHAERDGIDGLVSIFGGKLTTYRLMAEHAMKVVCRHLNVTAPCRTADTPLESGAKSYHTLPGRLARVEPQAPPETPPQIICECELIPRGDLEAALRAVTPLELDDVRRDLRLGMGPCQASFCAYRAAGIAHETLSSVPQDGGLGGFLQERWRGIRPLGWGHTLRQMELMRRVYLELFAAQDLMGEEAAQ